MKFPNIVVAMSLALALSSLAALVIAVQEPTPAIAPGTDVITNTNCVGGCVPCVKPVPKQCGSAIVSDCGHALCDILFGTPPGSVVVPPIEIWYTKCHQDTGERGTGTNYQGFIALQDPRSPDGYKDVYWPKDVVCSVTIKCDCDGASLDPLIVTHCSNGAETPKDVVRRTVVFDPTLTCDNITHPNYPPDPPAATNNNGP